MKYAEVAVNAPGAWPRTFTYHLPPDPPISVGSAVWVPFGPRLLQGIVFNLVDSSPVEVTREIAELIGTQPLLTLPQIELAKWISQYYLAPFFHSAALMLPPGFERRILTFLEVPADISDEKVASLSPEQRKVFHLCQANSPMDLRQLYKHVPKKRSDFIVNQLVHLGLIIKTTQLERPRINPKLVPHIRLAVDLSRGRNEVISLKKKRAKKQADLLELLILQNSSMLLADAREQSRASLTSVRTLERNGLVIIEQVRTHRDPLAHRNFPHIPPPVLTEAQELAWQKIKSSLQKNDVEQKPSFFLLHGITGSGKTEIYLQALEQVIALGKKAIVLVPEIALTPQTIARFSARFPDRVAVLHSKLSPGEQFDEWYRIKDGEFDVVIGSRSAIFAPQPDIGLIVIDEEHEWTYKQHDRSPLYHARDVALKLAELLGAVVILGSATPDLESYHRAYKGDFQLLELSERVGQQHNGVYPKLSPVEIVDLRQELKQGNRSIFSRKLASAIHQALATREQVILFLNRRGTSSFVQCRDCGHVMHCRRCELALTYHAYNETLVCHQCNLQVPVPKVCPICQSRRIKFLGIGTQKVEAETAREFPRARILRWDRDITKGKYAHEQILDKFLSHQADILIGTQMIAKGLDIPLVTLVGVINADVGLFLPDFRAGERTFQLLSQVAGRAGRGIREGRVIIQTYAPEHYAIMAAAKQNFRAFHDQEIAFRRQLGNPPFSHLATMVYMHTNAERCQMEAEKMSAVLQSEIERQGRANTSVVGPAPAFAERVRGRYRWVVTLRGPDPAGILSRISIPTGWSVDIDPAGMT